MRLLRRLHPRQSASDVSCNRSKDLNILTAISIKCPFKKAPAKTGDRFRNTCNSISQIMKIASVANKGANNFAVAHENIESQSTEDNTMLIRIFEYVSECTKRAISQMMWHKNS